MDIIERALERLAELDTQAEDYGEHRMVQLSPEDVQLLRDALEAAKQAQTHHKETMFREGDLGRVTAKGDLEGQTAPIVAIHTRRYKGSVRLTYRLALTFEDGRPRPLWFSADEIEPV
jgi:hypothetical protein